jgi:hypothetical protein
LWSFLFLFFLQTLKTNSMKFYNAEQMQNFTKALAQAHAAGVTTQANNTPPGEKTLAHKPQES